MSQTITYTGRLVTVECWCGIAHAIPDTLDEYVRLRKKSVYCPLGHTWIYGNTVEQQLERERQRHRATRELLEQEERSHAATRGHLTRQRRRAKAGLCPCCNRTFENVARHMATKHPDFKPEGA